MSNKITLFWTKKQEFFIFFFNNRPNFLFKQTSVCYKYHIIRELSLICSHSRRGYLRLGIGV